MSNFKPFLLGICGGSASGKTSVSHVIYKTLGVENCLLFSMDNYYFLADVVWLIFTLFITPFVV